jgi:hypothetical protein
MQFLEQAGSLATSEPREHALQLRALLVAPLVEDGGNLYQRVALRSRGWLFFLAQKARTVKAEGLLALLEKKIFEVWI